MTEQDPILAAIATRLQAHENRILAGAIVMDKDRADLDYLHKFMQLRSYMMLEQLNIPALLERVTHQVECNLEP